MSAADIPTRYDSDAVEDRWYRHWEEGGLFHPDPGDPGDPFCIVIPPPNVTGVLHMGHGLDNTFQDLIIRRRRMQGRNTLWMPGTDHAGIATQNVVERELREEGLHRDDLGRETFLEKVWEWKEKNGSTIVRQLRRLGASCDWQRERFTMDDGLSRAVREVFCRLWDDDLIYRGEYLVNWCPRCSTALSNEESIPTESEGTLSWIRYPRTDGDGHVTVATTRPETMLGDTAVAVHPDDERWTDLVGGSVTLPLVDREIPVVADDYIDREFGTGALKVTPGHDVNDFEIGRRHELDVINVLNEDGTMADTVPERFRGMDRFECREAVVRELDEQGLLEKREPFDHNVPHCQRCDAVVEPFLSTQWFVRMKPLAEPAIAAVEEGSGPGGDGKAITFHPARWERDYLRWMTEIRDWCISRQLWWGHRIPAWHCECGAVTVSRTDDPDCTECGTSLGAGQQDPDVLDTWFSSWLWPFSTLGWPDETDELRTWYPTDVLVTGPDIIFFWVARMIMAGYYCMDDRPFADVYLHGMVTDDRGRPMSKSLGNGIDPLEMIETYSADALRFSLVMLTAEGQDCRLSEEKIEMGRNFCNKVWNACRFALMNLEGTQVPAERPEPNALEDRWILDRLAATVESLDRSWDAHRYNEGLVTLRSFVWDDLCDWYLELAKPRLDGEGADADAARATLAWTLSATLRLLHPIIPFLTEEMWHRLREVCDDAGDLAEDCITAPWPAAGDGRADAEARDLFAVLQQVTRAVRNLRAKLDVKPSAEVAAQVSLADAARVDAVESNAHVLRLMAGVGDLTVGAGLDKPDGSASDAGDFGTASVLFGDDVDVAALREGLQKKLDHAEKGLRAVEGKLSNDKFVQNAPDDVVQGERDRREELQRVADDLRAALSELD